MQPPKKTFKNTDEYIAMFPSKVRQLLQKLRTTIKKYAPGAEEVISYNIPAFKLNGLLVFFAGYEHHIGFYPTSSPLKVFKERLVKYKTSKGAIQFPIEDGVPVNLVRDIVKFRVNENTERVKRKAERAKPDAQRRAP